MSEMTEQPSAAEWNVVTCPWLEVLTLNGEVQVCSPLEALSKAQRFQCIASASPLDLFATHRFLLTLLYWKADLAGGVKKARESLLCGAVPETLLANLRAESHRFRLFDDEAPFLQDPSLDDLKKSELKSAGSLFAEFASGSRVAHFHHGDDKNMRLCLRCATVGLMRLVPWTQSGGRGLSPSIHNAPPVFTLATGPNLAATLGLNLIPLSENPGEAKWTGHFVPSGPGGQVPYLEAFTWNPRRVHLGPIQPPDVCWRCGETAAVIGQIAYEKNGETRMPKDPEGKAVQFKWEDPAAFYAPDSPYKPMKSTNEERAASGRDLEWLCKEKDRPGSAVLKANAGQVGVGWDVIVPCTDPQNNKAFDHRQVHFTNLSPQTVRGELSISEPIPGLTGRDGWNERERHRSTKGTELFVKTAARLLTDADWSILSAAAYHDMHKSPAAFDVLAGLHWGLRDKNNKNKMQGLPSRNVAWLTLKLMSAVPAQWRAIQTKKAFCPLDALPKRQDAGCLYPVSFPMGNRLEASIREILANKIRKEPGPIDWIDLCNRLDQLID